MEEGSLCLMFGKESALHVWKGVWASVSGLLEGLVDLFQGFFEAFFGIVVVGKECLRVGWKRVCARRWSVADPSAGGVCGSLFERGLQYVGTDYLAHALWDKYLQFEQGQGSTSGVVALYSRILSTPLKELHRFFYGQARSVVEVLESFSSSAYLSLLGGHQATCPSMYCRDSIAGCGGLGCACPASNASRVAM
jgi:hypothetical protein